jgi:hypothetical protein
MITTITRPRRSARHVLPLALGICALAIPATASASPQYSSVSSITGGSEKESSQPVGSSDYSSASAITGGSSESSSENPGGSPAADSGYASLNATTEPPASEPTVASGYASLNATTEPPASEPTVASRYASLNATAGPPASEPTVLSGSPADPADGFDWASAGVGAGAAMALLALSGAAFLTVRRHTAVSPSGASMS